MNLQGSLSQAELEDIIKEWARQRNLIVKTFKFGFLEIIPPELVVDMEFDDIPKKVDNFLKGTLPPYGFKECV